MQKKVNLQQLAFAIISGAPPPNRDFWSWLGEVAPRPVDMKRANKWFLGCILDYQIVSRRAWENARRLAEGTYNDPDDLWGTICAHTEEQWMSKFESYSLHRFPKAHHRVWRIGRELVRRYRGDARRTWIGKTPAGVMANFKALRLGVQISNMAIGCLIDTKQIAGTGDVKADSNVCRVLGRIVDGKLLSPQQVTHITQQMCPTNPWLLDRPLYLLGKGVCASLSPKCDEYYVNTLCTYARDAT